VARQRRQAGGLMDALSEVGALAGAGDDINPGAPDSAVEQGAAVATLEAPSAGPDAPDAAEATATADAADAPPPVEAEPWWEVRCGSLPKSLHQAPNAETAIWLYRRQWRLRRTLVPPVATRVN